MANFHEFYNAVDVAKNIFLTNTVKAEVPNFVQINCDGFDDDIQSVKEEPVNVDYINFEPSSLEMHGSRNQVGARGLIDINKRDDEETGFNASIDKMPVEATTAATLDENTYDSPQTEALEEEIDQLCFKQMDIRCGLCNHPLSTASQAVNHHRSEHNANAYHKQIIKCCDRQLLPYDIRDHVQYHSNPNAFK